MIGKETETVLNRAVRFAVEQEHEYFTLEHVFWSLLAEKQIGRIIEACGGSSSIMRQEVEAYLHTQVPHAPLDPDSIKGESQGGAPLDESVPSKLSDRLGDESGEEQSPGRAEYPVATLGIQRLLQRALLHVQSAGKEEVQPVDLFVAFFQAKESHALYLLSKQGIERLDILNFISHGICPGDLDQESGADPDSDQDPGLEDGEIDENQGRVPRRKSSMLGPRGAGEGESRESREDPSESEREMGNLPLSGSGEAAAKDEAGGDDPLTLYASNLNERARRGKIDPLIGRSRELERMVQTLCRRRKNNPLLVGEAGVGKTALAEGLALRIIEKKVPSILRNCAVYSLDLGSLIAGTKFRGDFEQRLKKVLTALEKKKRRGEDPILLIDEIHTIIGAGAVSGGALDAANLLKPVFAQGEIRCIGSTTYAEYRSVFEKDHALARRFQKIDVPEPSVDEAVQILEGLKPKFEEHHGVHYSSEAIQAAVELSSRHLNERFLPDKAIDVIDEAGAKARLSGDGKGGRISAEAIEEVVSQIARIPARSVSVSQKERLKVLDKELKRAIFGQHPAVDALVTSIRLARSGLRSGEKPVGCFLFCGPTGVGKTELSKQLASCLGVPFLRFDMSEYSERHTLSRLIGAPPGYVGFEQAGLLTDAVMKNPHSVLLLDEIEKSHSDIWNILLQVMDHGRLTDNNGRKADFRNVILIMTSNVGSREMERRQLGMGPVEAASGNARRVVEQTFTPEFRNRLDAIVYFNSLDPATMAQVVEKQLAELEAQLLSKGVKVAVSADARDWLCAKGYDRTLGARPLARLIQDRIKKPLSEEILFGKLENGGEVRLYVKDEELAYEVVKSSLEKAQGPGHVSQPATEETPLG